MRFTFNNSIMKNVGKYKLYLYCALLAGIFILNCTGGTRNAFGPRDVVNVVMDEQLWEIYGHQVKNILWDTRYYPSFEHVFDVEYSHPERFRENRTDYFRRHYLLIISTDDTQSPSYKIIREQIPDSFGLFHFDDLWASPQKVVMIIQPESELKEFIEEHQQEIFDLMFQSASNRLYYMLYKQGDQYQQKLQQELISQYEFNLKLPSYYVVAQKFGIADSGAVISVQHMRSGSHNAVSRYFAVFWRTDPDYEFDLDSFTDYRNQLAEVYFDNDILTVNDTYTDSLGLCIEGIWQNPDQGQGGPWRGWIVKDQDRIFLIETHVFSPGNKKTFYLEELKIIANTFEALP